MAEPPADPEAARSGATWSEATQLRAGSYLIEVLDASGAVTAAEGFEFALQRTGTTASGGQRLALEVRYGGTGPLAAAIRYRLLLPGTPDPWWLMPGAFYGENRPAACDRVFPRFEVGASDPQAMVSDRWEFRADRCATPAVFVWNDSEGVALVADDLSPVGMTGLGIAHDAQSGVASIQLTFPYQEGPVTYYGSATPLPADVTTHEWQPGEEVRLEFAQHALPADRHAYAPILRQVHADKAASSPITPWVPLDEAADIAAEGLYRWHYDPEPGVLLETVGFDRGVSGQDGKSIDRQAMHVGWVSGIPWAYALLAHGRRLGRADEVAAAEKVIGFICDNLSPSGSFWGTWYRSSGWTQSWTPIRRGIHSRTLAEATLFLLRALELGEDVRAEHPAWAASARSNLEVIVNRQREDGNVGSVHHAETGEVLSWEGASGLTWVATLAEAARYDDGDRYLSAAIRAGEYYASFVEREFIHGAPEDVDLAPTSEDGYAAVMAYMALHRRTGEERWLDLARRSADWMLTFRYSYNVSFDPLSILGVYRFATRGADQASTSNQHLGAYGLVCTQELDALSEALGDPHYRLQADETLACFRQLLAVEDGQVNAYRGMITERYYQTNCFQPKGMLLTLSHAWCVGVLLLACEQRLAA